MLKKIIVVRIGWIGDESLRREAYSIDLKKLARLAAEMYNNIRRLDMTLEKQILSPIIEPMEKALRESIGEQLNLYNFRIPQQPTLEELKEKIKNDLGVEGDLEKSLRETFKDIDRNSE